MNTLIQSLLSTGGFTYQPMTDTTPVTGLALSIYPQASKVINALSITGQDLQDYIASQSNLLSDPTNFVGAWHDLDSGRVYLDISKVLNQSQDAQAVSLCEQFGQRAYWNIGLCQEVRVVSEEFAHAA